MDVVTVLRELSRRRRYVAAVFVFAVLVGVAVEFQLPSLKSRSYETGSATEFILVDTPDSQVVSVSPRGSDTTAARASLLASLMIDGEIKSIIAQQAGLQSSQLSATTTAAINPPSGGGPATSAGAPASGSAGFSFTTQVPTDASGNSLPIIQLNTMAPTNAGAVKLANAAIAGLSEFLSTKAKGEGITDADRLHVSGMGAPQATTVSHGPGGSVVIIVVLVVFLLGCAGILGGQALARGWRAAAERERLGDDSGPSVAGPVASEPEAFPRALGADESFPPRPAASFPPVGPIPRSNEPFPRLVHPSRSGSDTVSGQEGGSPGENSLTKAENSFRTALRAER
jgi:hypothetical protein